MEIFDSSKEEYRRNRDRQCRIRPWRKKTSASELSNRLVNPWRIPGGGRKLQFPRRAAGILVERRRSGGKRRLFDGGGGDGNGYYMYRVGETPGRTEFH